MRDKRIAIVSGSFPPFGAGGVASAHYNLYRALVHKGYDVKVFTYNVKGKREDDVIRHGTPPLIVRLIRSLIYLFFSVVDRGKIAYQLSDILVSAWGSIKINSSLMRFRPDVLVLPDHGCPGFFINKKIGCKFVLISHHNPMRFLDESLLGIHSRVDAQMALRIENRALRKVDHVICPSNYMKGEFNKSYKFNGSVSVVPDMVDEDLIASVPANDLRGDLGLPEGSALIYIPSAGSRLKGSLFIPEIIQRLAGQSDRKVGFYLSGDVSDDLRHELSSALPNKALFIPGRLSLEKNISIVKACSFGISPTLIESFGMAILEANFCGLPMVVFDAGGTADVIRNGENGFIVPRLDVDKLVYYSEKLLDDGLRNEMREKTVRYVHDRFNAEVVAVKFLEVLSQPVSKKLQ